MNKYLLDKIDVFTEEIQRLRRRREIVSFLSLLVVFVTVNALMLPAITLEKKAICGYEEHVHNEECYSDVSAPEYLCLQNFHHHGEECYKDGELVCNILLAHIHNELCCDSMGNLLCPLEEIIPHTHSDECKNTELMLTCNLEEDYHEHSDDCYIVHDGKIICDIEETEGHTHSEQCYTVLSTELICGNEETEGHAHGDECYQFTGREMICVKEETQGHTHADGCYADTQVLKCTVAETRGHTHSESCFIQENILLCTAEENENHTHDENCFTVQQTMVCGLQEQPAHSHIAECYEIQSQLTCTQVETEPHIHGDSCYEDKYELICTQQEVRPHIHTERCYKDNLQLVCEIEEKEPHTHGTECYEKIKEIGCEKEEKSDGHLHTDECYEEKTTIVCTEKEVILHTHTETCYDSNGVLVCEQTEIAEHIHTEECTVYKPLPDPVLICELEEHLHTDECYPPEETDDRVLICIREQHIHTDACGDTCEKQEHKHTDDCYKPAETREAEPTPTPTPDVNVYDISNGPIVIVQFGESVSDISESEEDVTSIDVASPVMMFATRQAINQVVDLKDYLEEHNGNINIELVTIDDSELPKDENGNYIISSGTSYKLSMIINIPDGIEPGYYQYKLPYGIQPGAGTGDLEVNGVVLGTWTITSEGLLVLDFHEISNTHTEVTVTAQMGVKFTESENPIDFDGKISVVVRPPEEDLKETELLKWGGPGDASQGQDPNKIYWNVLISGYAGSNIPGSIITDSLVSQNQTYTQSDMENGLEIGIQEKDLNTGQELNWYSLDVHIGDPGLTWTENGWQYRIPEKFGDVVLGNEGWTYYIKYTSTPDPTKMNGIVVYQNNVIVDYQQQDGWAEINFCYDTARVVKNGVFQGGADGGEFIWDIYAKIPAAKPGEKYIHSWHIYDSIIIRDDNWDSTRLNNAINNSTVTAIYPDGTEIPVKNIEEVTADDPFCWMNWWGGGEEGAIFQREINLFCKCRCTADTCDAWDNYGCWSGRAYNDKGFCQCWSEQNDMTFKFTYTTTQADKENLFVDYGGKNYSIYNDVSLGFSPINDPNGNTNVIVSSSSAQVPVPGVFKKELTQNYNGYVAKYTITVNEAKIQLTDGTPLNIRDEMTDTLAYINGSLIITAEDADGKLTTLTYGTDYTTTYDGSGDQKDKNNNPIHVLDIVINNPQPVKYTLAYDATLIIPVGTQSGIKYNNSATIKLWGKDLTTESEEKIYTNINVSAKTFRVSLKKQSAANSQPLAGAVFGLYNQNGGLIATRTSDANGDILFETNVTEGVILRDHELYYMREIKAPDGYIRDDTKHWICFCVYADANECTFTPPIDVEYKRIPENDVFYGNIYNSTYGYELPETGGTGTQYYTAGGLGLIIRAAALLLYRLKKYGKEDITSP